MDSITVEELIEYLTGIPKYYEVLFDDGVLHNINAVNIDYGNNRVKLEA